MVCVCERETRIRTIAVCGVIVGRLNRNCTAAEMVNWRISVARVLEYTPRPRRRPSRTRLDPEPSSNTVIEDINPTGRVRVIDQEDRTFRPERPGHPVINVGWIVRRSLGSSCLIERCISEVRLGLGAEDWVDSFRPSSSARRSCRIRPCSCQSCGASVAGKIKVNSNLASASICHALLTSVSLRSVTLPLSPLESLPSSRTTHPFLRAGLNLNRVRRW